MPDLTKRWAVELMDAYRSRIAELEAEVARLRTEAKESRRAELWRRSELCDLDAAEAAELAALAAPDTGELK